MVWDETFRIVHDLVNNVWKRADTVHIDHVLEITLPISLFVIGAAGFGRRLSFSEELEVPYGYQMNFKDALQSVCENIMIKLAIPRVILDLTKRSRKINAAFDDLQKYMLDMIHSRKQPSREERHDLFSSLLDAADDNSDGERILTDSELTGNIFIFLLAGHETTAHTLAFSLALLALYPDKQEKLFQEIDRVSRDLDGYPAYEEMPRFPYAMAVFYETLRMRPPAATVIPKYSTEDTALNVKDAEGRMRTIPIPKGTGINIHTVGLHNNPRYWESPDEFMPERFIGDYPKDAFLPFSGGPRACIGRRFAETEAVAVLTVLLSQYRALVKEDPKFAGESHKQRRARLLECTNGITTTPAHIPLTFERRVPI
ncbi:unnamed protein product [Peniophora sp. CBMAI 1063]|nr:unnamed protein product [Peniophora sp. CBMAI 1063]